jgi:hypothetical protein
MRPPAVIRSGRSWRFENALHPPDEGAWLAAVVPASAGGSWLDELPETARLLARLYNGVCLIVEDPCNLRAAL